MQIYLRFRRPTPLDLRGLQASLLERALEHDKPTLLLQLACEKLHREEIVRPGVTRLERLVATAREQMAQSTDISYRQLAWTTTWYLREETLEPATVSLVNYHHRLPFCRLWGSGILSSSDGQRFPVSGKNRQARPFPPTMGYGQGLPFYSWTSDQLSQYGSKPVIITERDATYVLDAILGNETELALLEHTTDTAGATEMIFALFDLLGLRFTPRLRDIGKRRLYRSGTIGLENCPRLRPAIKGRINRQRVVDWWDEMLRVAGSMKLGHVTASLLLQKLQAYPQRNALAQALQEYGRLIRTLYVVRWYANRDDRHRVMRQLNKGESLHDPRASDDCKQGPRAPQAWRGPGQSGQLSQAGDQCRHLVEHRLHVGSSDATQMRRLSGKRQRPRPRLAGAL